MSAVEILNLEALLTPISEENPVGADLREDYSPTSKYYMIQDLRTDARAAERAGAAGTDENNEVPGLANWKKILKEVPKCLEKDTKDLELAAWLTEALVRLHGFEGLLEGLQLIHQLVTQFGVNLYPQPDDDGIETQVAPIMGLSGVSGPGSLIVPVNCAAVIELNDGTQYSAWNYAQAVEVEKISDVKQRQKKLDSGVVELATIKTALSKIKEPVLTAKYAKIQECLAEVEHLTIIFNQFTNDPSLVSFGNLRQALVNCVEIIKPQIDKFTIAENFDLISENEAKELVDTTGAYPTAAVKGEFAINPAVLATRDEALHMLTKIVEFFRAHEPHSPISYSLEKIISWANMSLPELLNELIMDSNARRDFCRLSGVNPVQEPMQQPGQQPGMGMGMGGGSPYGGGPDNSMYSGMGGGYPGMGGSDMGDNSMFGNDF